MQFRSTANAATNHVQERKSCLRHVYSSDVGLETGSTIPLPGKIVEKRAASTSKQAHRRKDAEQEQT